ncbi:hypothetical protein Taro_032003 [Colocasia esculenta]|uniref:PP2A regulatory subunit TAP46 n=1 Tax=Colocasia esculenta TaxID=4460 RepID=A0A843VQB0_COLES|nr:hypothetical protein [Colocasia esculenta]
MGEWKMDEMPLPALFEQARKIHFFASESAVDQDTLRKGIEAFRRCDEMISTLGLFSVNETRDDVSTANLKYLLVPFYLGELTEKVADDDRIQLIKKSQDQLKEFISSCEALDLVPEEEIETSVQVGTDLAARRAKKEEHGHFILGQIYQHTACGTGLWKNIQEKKFLLLAIQCKIARFKRQRAAESKLQEIKERRERRGRSLKAAALSTPVEVGEEDLLDDDDGEEEREAWLTTISLALCKAFDMLEMLKKEEEMLSAVKGKQLREGDREFDREILDERTRNAETWHRNAATKSQISKPAQPITCATFAQDVIEGRAKASEAHEHKHQPLIFGPTSLIGGRLTSERERMAAQVFQPGYRLPTMSIEEAGLREMEMMNKWQERNAKLFKEANSSWHKDALARNDDDDDEDEAAEEKARAWDDWKDDNPRGAGNKKLTPCG